jgi:RimJ/RimL family protein N-acetyltransferase
MRARHGDHARHALLPGGTRIYLRRVREGDLDSADQYFAGLSERSRYLRFMGSVRTFTPETLALLRGQLRQADSSVIGAIVAHADADEIVGGVRIVPGEYRHHCEFAITVLDRWQGRGVGRLLMQEAMREARRLGYQTIEGSVLTANWRMLGLAQRARMRPRAARDAPGVVTVSRDLRHFHRAPPRASRVS